VLLELRGILESLVSLVRMECLENQGLLDHKVLLEAQDCWDIPVSLVLMDSMAVPDPRDQKDQMGSVETLDHQDLKDPL
jgi:hypothetical protein